MNNPTGPDATHLVEVVTTYVEMLTPDMLVPSPATDLDIIEAELPCPELNRFLYAAVGGHWYWVDRLGWRYDKWLDYVDCDTMHTCVGYVRGTPAGYFEAELQTDADVEIRSFGLLPQFIGRGYGGDLLTRAIRFAWQLGAARVWLHTCSLDSPRGLQNYLARGFQIYRTTREIVRLPHTPPGPWPDSGYPG